MNPLSPLTYYRRHKRQTLLLLILIALMTFGVCVMVRLPDTLVETAYNAERYMEHVSLVSATDSSLEAEITAQIRAHPDVAGVLNEKSLEALLTFSVAEYRLFGVQVADMPVLLDACELRLKDGRLPRPHSNEIALSEEIIAVMDVQIGDEVDRPANWEEDEEWYIPVPMKLVGILEDDSPGSEPGIRLGIVSYEYVSNHEQFSAPWRSGLVIVAQEGRRAEVVDFLETSIASSRVNARTARDLTEHLARVLRRLHVIFGIVDGLVVVVITAVVGMINQLAQAKRLAEFGTLNALGHNKRHLIRRLVFETAGVASVGWLLGLALSWGSFALLQAKLFEPNGMDLSLTNLTPLWFAIPIPLVAISFVVFNTFRAFTRLDAVAIVERGKLSLETKSKRAGTKRSSARPLSSKTFYLRHRRRGLLLAATIGLMILGVAFPTFIFWPMFGTMTLFAEPLRRLSIVSSDWGTAVDPGVTAQIRTHPDVSRVVPTIELGLRIDMPPGGHTLTIYGVSEDNLQALLDLYDVQVQEGHLPRPHTNQVVLSKAVARNRGLSIGDMIGQPVSQRDSDMTTEMEVVGILSSSDQQANDLWTGFASYEYLSSHEFYQFYPISMLVVPAEGHKDALDHWLEKDVASEGTSVATYETQLRQDRLVAVVGVLVFGIAESVVAVVAAIALASLSYIFFVQRKEEFGVLHAIGHSRWWLVLRTVKESLVVVGLAWLVGAILCGISLIVMQTAIYTPKGLTLRFFDPVPWLSTLPMPLAVVVSTGLVALMLRRLDPVAVIERR
jgi:ABC-type lipoprotein release transport system permease subunit